MMRLRFIWSWVPVVGVLAIASPSTAAPGDEGTKATVVAQNDDPARAQQKAAKRAKVMERIRALRAWKLTEALDLDEATAARLFPILNRYDAEFATAMRESRKLRRQIRKMSRAGGAKVTTSAEDDRRLLDRLVASQRKLWDLQEARFRDVRKVLTAKQAATIFVVLPELDRRIHKQVRRALSGKGGPGAKRGRRGQRMGEPGERRERKQRSKKRAQDTVKDPFGAFD